MGDSIEKSEWSKSGEGTTKVTMKRRKVTKTYKRKA